MDICPFRERERERGKCFTTKHLAITQTQAPQTYIHMNREREMEREKEMKQSKFKRMCVFCGSSPGKKSSYKDAALELGRELVYIILLLSVFSSVLFCFFNANH